MHFFELLQVALGNKDRLSSVPSPDEWAAIYNESERQTVTGVMLHGVDRLPLEQRPPKAMLLQWIGVGQMIEQRNQVMDEHCLKLLKMLEEHSLKGSILKGQGIAKLYVNLNDDLNLNLGSLRQSGDIDVYVDCGLKGALAYAKSIGQKEIEWDYKHLHLNIWDDIAIEMHYRVEVLLNLQKNRKLQKWFERHTEDIFGHTDSTDNTEKDSTTNFTNDTNNCPAEIKERAEIVTPSVVFNSFYILLHIYRHFLYEGVGLRQIMDYYFVLKNLNDNLNVNESYAYKAVHEFGMTRFARGLMWVMHEVLGMPGEWMLWEPDEKEGRYILEQVMMGGNFGHHDERLKHSGGKLGAVKAILTHNMHLLTHYPADTIWAPVWIVWHKLWKMTRRV